MGFRNPIVGGTSLIRSAIKSPDYDPGTAGWTINKDGTAEFNNLTVRGVFEGTTSEITEDGIFFYAGPPATTKLVGSWATNDGIDPYGNPYVSGLTVYDFVSGEFAHLGEGTLSLGSMQGLSPDLVNAGGMNGKSGLVLTSSVLGGTTFDDPVRLALNSGQQNAESGSSVNPFVRITDFYQTSAVDVGVSGALVQTAKGGAFTSWHAPTMGTGWATGPGISGSYPLLKYHLLPFDAVWLHGSFHATSTTPAGVLATGLPLVNMTTLGGVASAGCAAKVSSSSVEIPIYLNGVGEMRHAGLPAGIAVNDTYMINAIVPLGNIA